MAESQEELKQRRMPEEIWEMAVDVARQDGVSRTASKHGLGYTELKKRVDAANRRIEKGTEPFGGGFVELPRMAGCGQMRVEVNRPDGCLLRIELGSGFGVEVAPIMRAFLGQS